MIHSRNPENGQLMPKYETAQELLDAIDAYFRDPPKRTVQFRDMAFEVPDISTQSVALELGFASRQSLYDQKERGDDFKFVIERCQSYIKHFYELQGQHGNGAFSQFILATMGEKAVAGMDHTSSDGTMTPKRSLDDFYKDSE